MQELRNEEVHRSQHHAVWIVAIALDFLDHRNDCNDVHQQEAYRKTMHKHWQHVVQTVPVQNIIAPIHRHQVCILNIIIVIFQIRNL